MTLDEIAVHWAEEHVPRRSAAWILRQLKRAVLRGELKTVGWSRLDIMKDSLWGPLRPETDPETWTEEQLRPVFDAVADTWPCVYYVQQDTASLKLSAMKAASAFNNVQITNNEFFRWLKQRCLDIPTFWGPFLPETESGSVAPPSVSVQRGTLLRRRRGRPDDVYTRVVANMRAALDSGEVTPEQLDAMKQKQLPARFGCRSHSTARKARDAVLAPFFSAGRIETAAHLTHGS